MLSVTYPVTLIACVPIPNLAHPASSLAAAPETGYHRQPPPLRPSAEARSLIPTKQPAGTGPTCKPRDSLQDGYRNLAEGLARPRLMQSREPAPEVAADPELHHV